MDCGDGCDARATDPWRVFECGAGNAASGSRAVTDPTEVASAEHSRHRLSRGGDRQLNAALHIVAMVQVRTVSSAGHGYVKRKPAEGKTSREALRCLKRRLADITWRTMLRDERSCATILGSGSSGPPWPLDIQRRPTGGQETSPLQPSLQDTDRRPPPRLSASRIRKLWPSVTTST